jgi:hypothetical protein
MHDMQNVCLYIYIYILCCIVLLIHLITHQTLIASQVASVGLLGKDWAGRAAFCLPSLRGMKLNICKQTLPRPPDVQKGGGRVVPLHN